MPANCKGDLRKRNNYTDLSVPKKISSKHHYEHFSIRDGFDNIDDFYEFFQQYGEEKLSMEIIYWRLR
jgi:hypothetical protein